MPTDQKDQQPTAPPPGEETKGDRTRARIVRAAHDLFVDRGYHGTSMRQIAEEAGLALGGIYNHFSAKEDIFTAVVLEHNPYLELVSALETARGETVEDLVHDAAERMLTALGGRPESLHLMFVAIVEFEGQHFAQLLETIFPQMLSFARRLTQLSEHLRPIPPPTLIRAFMGFFFAYFMTEWLLGDGLPASSRQGAFEDFVDIYLHGILRDEKGRPT